MAGIGDLGKLFGKGSPAQEMLIWAVLAQLIGAAMSPELELLVREINKALPSTPLSPDQLADMVVRHIVQPSDGESYARESGIAPADFHRLVQSAGEGLAPGDLAEALRRNLIPETGAGGDVVSFDQGIAESHIRDKWAPIVKALSIKEPSPIDPLDALLQGQLDYGTAVQLYRRFGGDPEHFTWLFNSRGSAPTPVELGIMAHRRVIPWDGEGPDAVSFHQGFLEGPWRNKWEAAFRRLAEYVPPPRTVTAMVHNGTVSDEQALSFYEQSGLVPDVAQLFLADAHHTKAAVHKAAIATELRTVARRGFADGHLSEAQFRHLLSQANLTDEQVEQEVEAANLSHALGTHAFTLSQIKHQRQSGIIDDAQAVVRLVAAGWSQEDAQSQVDLWVAEAKAGRTGLTESRILAYLNAKVLTAQEAYDLLTQQGINAKNAAFLVAHPEAVPAVKTHGSSAADIMAAYKDGILDIEQARKKLIEIGHTAEAADLKLQVAHYTLNRGPKPKLAHKNLTEAHVLEALRLGLVTDTWALRELVTMGYSDADASLIVAIEETKHTKALPDGWAVLS